LSPGKYPWNGSDASRFRSDFGAISQRKDARTRFPEHLVESMFIQAMESSRGGLLAPLVGHIKPVKIANCPLQLPLPLSASKGYPTFPRGAGHVDILARRGLRRGVRISLWELKQPGKIESAFGQAFIYSLTMLRILRMSGLGRQWYRLCGFSGDLPHKLVLEAVVALSQDQERSARSQFQELSRSDKFTFGGDRIQFYLALYEANNLKVTTFDPLN
jgi:hypothetical protein